MDTIDVSCYITSYFVSDGWLIIGVGMRNMLYVCKVVDIGKLSIYNLHKMLPLYVKNGHQIMDEIVKDLYSLVWYGQYPYFKWQILQPNGSVSQRKKIKGIYYSLTVDQPKSNKAFVGYKKENFRVQYLNKIFRK